MSGPEGGVMTSSSNIDMRLVYNSDGTNIYHPIPRNSPPYHPGGGGGGAEGSAGMVSHGMNTNTNMNMGGGESQPMKKKRGRPRKYGPDSSVSLSLPPPFVVAGAGGLSPPSQQQTVPAPVSAGGPASPPPTVKKGRGRPPGAANKRQQLQGLGSAGNGFTPHVITVQAGEDVSSKIMAFSQNGPRAICILSANGAISNVTLRQAATSGGTVTYEGRFEILSLSGSFLVSDFDGRRSRTGGLSVSLAGPNGRVLGGGVAGLLIAATPIQVVVGSFMPETEKETKEAHHPTEDLLVSKHAPGVGGGGGSGGTGGSSPPSHGTLSESSGGAASPLNHSTGACHNSAPPSRLSGFPWN